MTERSRSTLYRGLVDLLDDEEAVGEMMSYFPARDAEEPATKEFVRAEIADVRAEIHASANKLILWSAAANTTLVAIVLAITRLA